MSMMQNTAAGTIRASLRYPAFRRLLSALAVSQIGGWIHNLAPVPPFCTWTHSAAWAGAFMVARVVPIVVLGPLGGAIADRFDQRLIMIVPATSRLAPCCCCWHSPLQRTSRSRSRRRSPQRRPWQPRPAWDVSPPPPRGWSMMRTCQARTRPVGGHLHRCRGWARARGRRAPVRGTVLAPCSTRLPSGCPHSRSRGRWRPRPSGPTGRRAATSAFRHGSRPGAARRQVIRSDAQLK